MSKKVWAMIFLCLLVLSFIVIAVFGSRYTGSFQAGQDLSGSASSGAEDWSVVAEDPGIVEISGVRMEEGRLRYDLRALGRGTTFILVETRSDGIIHMQKVYVHRLGIITMGTYFGNCTGGFMIPLSILILSALLWADRFSALRAGTKETLYSYRNILNLGLLVFLTFFILELIRIILVFHGIDASITSVLSSAEAFAIIAFPAAFIIAVLISLSNLSLMRKEGVNWHNMLGFILGLGLCLMTVLPEFLYTFLLRHQIVDIFNEKGIGTHLYSLFEDSVFFVVAYLECILAGTVVFGIRAARHIPSFDKDYILILGSQIRVDGTLTPLLRSRADKAIDFARMQKEATGSEIVFVPSGGKGEDEIIAEADAIGNYLLSKGVPEERILIENQSRSTFENIRNSMKLIRDDAAKATFSTTNYHVFRAGLIAYEMGYRLEGIGSPTKRYFWVNAFIREFIATLVSEKRRHLKVIAILLAGAAAMAAVNYLSKIL